MALGSHTLLAAAILLCGLAFTLALPGDMPRWCRCPRTTNNFISPKHYKKLEIITPGAYCRQTEIIITLKSNKTICVAPETDWINKVIRLMQRKENASGTERSPIALTEDGGERL